MTVAKFGFGAPLRRKEDATAITGRGRYTADIVPEGAAHAVLVRAPVAHARFTLEGIEEARAAPGVLDVITGADTAALGPLPCRGMYENADGTMPPVPPYPILPQDTVRHVGEQVAMVVAETLQQARDAAEMIGLDFDELPHVVEAEAALAPDAPVIWPDFGGNLAIEAEHGDKQATDQAFAKADQVVSIRLVNNRIVTNFLEPRAAIGEFDPETGRYTLTCGSQGVHLLRPVLADEVFGVPREKVHVITPDVGGGFGTKFFTYREYALVLFAAARIGRPVAWVADRVEHFLADYHGRDHVSYAELALDRDARFLGLRVDTIANLGAYLGQMALFVAANGAGMVPGCYRTPAVYARVRGAYTNTVPVDAYRGAGRPEASYLIERLVDKAALELGLAPDEIRRRNFIAPDEMPFETPTGRNYDTSDFAAHMKAAMALSDWDGFAARREESARHGRLRGIGMSTYIEACAGGGPEYGAVELDEEGGATVFSGTQTNGQGHHTAYAQLVGTELGIDPDKITVVQGDSDRIPRGFGTGGSRSIPVGGVSVYKAAERLAERVRTRAAEKLEAAAGDLELVDGEVRIVGTDRSVALAEIVKAMPADERGETEDWQPSEPTFPNGTHIAEVEVDPDTGGVEILRFSVVDDFGTVLNPLLLEGQIHGGVVQGIGQALTERTVYDPESGQLITASLTDYGLPHAEDLPSFAFDMRNIPSNTNALGMKGAGEAGAIGACAALVNAVVHALNAETGATHVDMPMTPETIWRALRKGD
ncbi:MAG TPA: xanthine dehydrogenase family protein molybdopterin-binding subunit [Hyphomicrobiales bacterium]|nr:xanthine dehydrogenase family protein molybdopterin-binding subunit [Hyphomicrobiales bacterium]